MIGVRRPSVCLMSRTSALTRKRKGLGRLNFAQGYPRSHATPTPTSRSKGQKSRWGGGILWRPPSRTACCCLYVPTYFSAMASPGFCADGLEYSVQIIIIIIIIIIIPNQQAWLGHQLFSEVGPAATNDVGIAALSLA